MDVDQFLAQPPDQVFEDGFSQRIAMGLYRERMHHRNRILAGLIGLVILILVSLPLQTMLWSLWQLSEMALSPFVPFVFGAVLLLLFAWQPRLIRF